MAHGRRQSAVFPEDGYVTLHLGHLRPELEKFMSIQEPGTTLAQALRELIELGLSAVPPETAIHTQRRRALIESRQYVFERLAQSFEEIRKDLANTAVILKDE